MPFRPGGGALKSSPSEPEFLCIYTWDGDTSLEDGEVDSVN